MLIKNIKSNNYHYLIKLTKSFYIILSIYRELSIFFYCLYKISNKNIFYRIKIVHLNLLCRFENSQYITKIRKLLTNNENLNKLIT